MRAECKDGRVLGVTLRNVPAFAAYLETPIEVAGRGTVTVDVGYGGMTYVMADATRFGLAIAPQEGAEIVRVALDVLAAAREQCRSGTRRTRRST